jgi:hypothetical protein
MIMWQTQQRPPKFGTLGNPPISRKSLGLHWFTTLNAAQGLAMYASGAWVVIKERI